MTNTTTWLTGLITVAILLVYEAALLLVERRNPARLARSAHATLREEWFAALSKQRGSEILAVQTLRNSLMSATMTASTAALGLMGAATLAAPSLNASFGAGDVNSGQFTARLALELVLMTVLFASLVCSAMAVRYYNHAGFISSMPVDSDERGRWAPTGAVYLRRAGLLYSWGLRHLLMVAPLLASIVYPLAGPVAAVIVVVALLGFDRFTPA
ncbi:MAG: DUF599 domain-containing protein [Polaromonas sp.]|uniref:DUF599 domain-containing protein n=1 Tax=Polaromonas sp. TaxID=1869339 RepID=UPI0027348069|nr:DUF599 domain-containing protein [Polaromonas sp.]MDP3795856.1 DUF599 domain-containing protein [Polaromonas sp.]